MVKVQIDLTEDEDRLVEIFKAENRIDTKENTIKEMVKRSGKCKHKFDLVDKYKLRTPPNWKMHIIQRCVYCGEIKKEVV